ncbi:MAG: hypothetical protein SFX73_08205 [Kofleriaceae bacterium]|nr:hypothetical protein [Kofleriaceae bacterium]
MKAHPFLWVLLAACDVPSPSLRLSFSSGPSQECPSIDCKDLPLTCDAWVSIRILDPAVPDTPYLSECKPVRVIEAQDDLCALGGVEIEPRTLPLRDLEYQVAVIPASMVTRDENNAPVCPTNIQYDAVNGFPVAVSGQTTPALGGRGYYRPGDDVVSITLGCTNLDLVNNDSCIGEATVQVSATVDDFDTRISVGAAEAGRLDLSVGEPRASGTEFVLEPGDVAELVRKSPTSWGVDAELFDPFVCLAVFDDVPQSTTALTCQPASITDEQIDFTGVRLTKASLDQILDAIALSDFPSEGLTIGIVLDVNGNPRSGIRVTAKETAGVVPTIRYLSNDRTSVTGTSTSGGQRGAVFVSTDAPFGTEFSATTTSPSQTVTALGGRIEGKVTIVVLRFPDPILGE